jgi:hypothetical protein
MRKIREIAAFLVSLFVLTASANVQAATLDFSFSWTNTFGTVPGTVTGEIRGLSDGLGLVFQPASAIFVTSAPAALGFPASPSDNLLTFSNFGVPTAVNSNLFLVLNGQIFLEDLSLDIFPGILVVLSGGSGFIQTQASSAGNVTFNLVTPIPAALPLFATGLGALGLLGWRRKRNNAATGAA